MKGKNQFTKQEAQQIEQLIKEKLVATTLEQKGIRTKIRRLGFYASDFGLRGGYAVQDFRNAVTIGGSNSHKSKQKDVSINTPNIKTSKKAQSDESYIVDLCDEVLGIKAFRQHRFDFLRGDTGVKLPVDAYYPSLYLVIEYYEKQHTEAVPHFDKRMTVSGITRGEQRKKYDQLRQSELPKNGIKLTIFNYSEFESNNNKRLVRNRVNDIKVIKQKLLIK